MKAHHFLAALLIILSFRFSYSQNEVERYKQPELIEGSNLIVSGSPQYFSNVINDSTSYRHADISLSTNYVKWRFTRGLNYSADTRINGSVNWNKHKEHGYSNSFNNNRIRIQINGGVSYYPLKENLLYGGFYTQSDAAFASYSKPHSDGNIFTYIGFGKLLNAGQTMYALNFGKTLKDEGIIRKTLSSNVLRKLTILLDKRRNTEFYSKYKDDADIEFFSQIEELLLGEKVISNPLNTRTTLKLFQALTNSAFVYFPRYKGFLVQAELGYIGSNYTYDEKYINSLRLILSGVYALPLGTNTNLIFSCFAGFPINNKYGGLLEYPLFHSPLILRDASTSYYPSRISQIENEKFKIIGGIKGLVYYNTSATSGISGFVNLSYGKTEDKKNNFVYNFLISFKYNILSRMRLSSSVEFVKDQRSSTDFVSSLQIDYIIF